MHSQQAFYKLRNAIATTHQQNRIAITPTLLLTDLFPRKHRRSRIRATEKNLGFKLSILIPPEWLGCSLVLFFVVSFLVLFANWQWGLAGIIFFSCAIWITNRLGNELKVKTVGDVAEKMASENYIKSRRNAGTFNKNEIENTLVSLFSETLFIDKSEITREASFV